MGAGHVFRACAASPESHIGHKRLENPYGIKTFARFELKINPTVFPVLKMMRHLSTRIHVGGCRQDTHTHAHPRMDGWMDGETPLCTPPRRSCRKCL